MKHSTQKKHRHNWKNIGNDWVQCLCGEKRVIIHDVVLTNDKPQEITKIKT
jgi:hypothetical protein